MKEAFKSAYRVRRILAKLGLELVNWNNEIEVLAYEAWCNREDCEYFNTHKYPDTQYSWY